jgi:sortase A
MRSFEKARQEQPAKIHVDDAASLADSRSQNAAAEISSEHSKVENDAGRAGANVHGNARVPLAILRIPRIHLEVPVLSGTDEITLNRGVGQIAGMAAPGEKGNIGIAGHRDGFFRNLKEISRGDQIELETTSSSATYVVNRVLITGPDDTSVLQPSGEQILTLVTCYPFHFIGPAPRRFVVQATLK